MCGGYQEDAGQHTTHVVVAQLTINAPLLFVGAIIVGVARFLRLDDGRLGLLGGAGGVVPRRTQVLPDERVHFPHGACAENRRWRARG